ncbi:DUF4190 domain-containing protein [Nesterenkonia marinintestina]|uniref:DUF4190 domain-containing protein n=1 Tax=Nesterenkonia marinintestina TaxID=2979865 RepID=UPI0021C12253|nr:DUF4190 domain-containing protein [Nesterenkonia sp. GX14115]
MSQRQFSGQVIFSPRAQQRDVFMTDQHHAHPSDQSSTYPPERVGLGIAAMVTGIVAIAIGWIPGLGMFALLLGPTAVVLGIISFLKRRGREQGLAGAITGGIGTIMATILLVLFGAIVSEIEQTFGSAPSIGQGDDLFDEGDEPVAEEDERPDSEDGIAPEPSQETEPEGGVTPLGEPVALTDWWSGSEIGTMTVESITPDFQCTQGSDVWQPESGAFLGVDLTVEASSEAEDSIHIEGYDFYVLDDDDQVTDAGLGSPAEYDCVPSGDLLDAARPGTSSSGLLLLDLDQDSGTLVYEGGDDEVRWEF